MIEVLMALIRILTSDILIIFYQADITLHIMEHLVKLDSMDSLN